MEHLGAGSGTEGVETPAQRSFHLLEDHGWTLIRRADSWANLERG
jgi:hypothetical protein